MAGHARLVDAHRRDEIVHLPLTLPQRRNHAASRRIGQGVENIYIHIRAYA